MVFPLPGILRVLAIDTLGSTRDVAANRGQAELEAAMST